MQRKETPNTIDFADVSELPVRGRIVSIDPGTRFVGIAVSDESQLVSSPLRTLARSSWKKLLSDIKKIVSDFDAVAVVVGLPLGFEGERIEMTEEAESTARKLSLSLGVPVFMQDERVTTYEARRRLWERGGSPRDTKGEVDAEPAAVILSDFLSRCGR